MSAICWSLLATIFFPASLTETQSLWLQKKRRPLVVSVLYLSLARPRRMFGVERFDVKHILALPALSAELLLPLPPPPRLPWRRGALIALSAPRCGPSDSPQSVIHESLIPPTEVLHQHKIFEKKRRKSKEKRAHPAELLLHL